RGGLLPPLDHPGDIRLGRRRRLLPDDRHARHRRSALELGGDELDLEPPPLADQADPDAATDCVADHQPVHLVDAVDAHVVHRPEQVPGAGAGARSGAVVDHLHDLDAALLAEAAHEPRRQGARAAGDPEVRAAEATLRHQGRDDAPRCRVDRDGEAETDARDGGGDPADPAAAGRPECPGLSAASVWITLSTSRWFAPERVGSDRPSAETTPAVTEPPNPCGLPIATTSCPTRRRSASPSGAGVRSLECARRTARSDSASVPTTSKSSSRPSAKDARRVPAVLATTCAEVSMYPSGVMTTELPPPSSIRPPRTRRATRRLPTDGVSRSATSITAREYASRASPSSKSDSGRELGCSGPRIASMSIRAIRAKLAAGQSAPSICESARVAEGETSRDGAVLTITLNRPDVLNAFNAAMHKALAAALKEARDDAVRAVVITGAGRGFCVGQDLTEFREAPGDIG